MVESTLEPDEIFLEENIVKGQATILCRWNIVAEERTEEGCTYTMWVYDECRLKWACPYTHGDGTTYPVITLNTRENVLEYLNRIKGELLSFAMMTKTSI